MRSVSGATAAARDGPRAPLADIARALVAALDGDKFPVFQTALALRDGEMPAPPLMERATRALGVGHMALSLANTSCLGVQHALAGLLIRP